MRRRVAGVLAAWLIAVAVAAPGASQPPGPGELPPQYLHFRSMDFPLNLDKLANQANKPSAFQLFYRVSGGRWQSGPRSTLDSLPNLSEGKRGLRFNAPDDGDYEFAIQYTFPDGSVSPLTIELRPAHRAIIDTTPPAVQIKVNGKVVEWQASDANLLPNATFQAKWAKEANGKEHGLDKGEWYPVVPKNRGPFRANDAFDWTGILPQGQELWVRVVAKDQAGNDGFSPPVRVPGNGTFGTSYPRPGGNSDWPPTGGGGVGLPKAPQPRIEYVSSLDVTVDYTLRKVTRSGVQAFYLYVQTDKDPSGWKMVEKFPHRPQVGEREATVQLKYRAEYDGLYGFYVVAENGAGLKDDPPTKNDTAMMFVVVDTGKPHAKITDVRARPGGARGPLVDFTWEVADPNLMPKAISLEYSVDKTAKVWNKIEYGLDNEPGKDTGRFTWEVPDENVWKFYVRIRAVDKAANMGEGIWEKEVIVDLEKPSGVITGVRGGSPQPGAAPPSAPPSTSPREPKEPKKQEMPAVRRSSDSDRLPVPDLPRRPDQ